MNNFDNSKGGLSDSMLAAIDAAADLALGSPDGNVSGGTSTEIFGALSKNHAPICDFNLRAYNYSIYEGSPSLSHFEANVSSPEGIREAAAIYDGYASRMREVYGDMLDELLIHEPGDERVCRMLVDDALRTGKWRELPECLYEAYKAAGGVIE